MIQERDDIEMLMEEDDESTLIDAQDDIGIEPLITIDLDEVNTSAQDRAQVIIERLSNYYFDDKYIKEHPYIPTKIMMEIDNIRRLLKMLMVNEKAQDALIKAIAISPGKGTLFISLTSMQKGTLLIQKQLNDMVSGIEQIFQRMQDESEKQWAEKEKDETDDGTITVRGSREFIKQLQNEFYKKRLKDGTVVNTSTGEIITDTQEKINADGTPEGATPIADILG